MSITKVISEKEETPQYYEESITNVSKHQFTIEDLDRQKENNSARIADLEAENTKLDDKKTAALAIK